MKQLSLYFSALTLFGCAEIFHLNSPKSQWIELSNTESLSCSEWPLPDNAIDNPEFHVVKDPSSRFAHFIVTTRMRNGQIKYVYYRFDGDLSFELENVREIVIDSDTQILLGSASENGEIAVINTSDDGSSSTIEYRNPMNNVMSSSSDKIKGIFAGGDITHTNGRVFTILEHDGSIIYLSKTDKGKKFSRVGNLKFDNMPILIPITDDETSLVNMRKEIGPANEKSKYFLDVYELTPQISKKPASLPLETSDSIESWDILPKENAWLAFLEGDSLVGQVKLHMQNLDFTGTPSIGEKLSLELNDVHLSKPIWVQTPNGPRLLMLKWLDAEATVGVYKITSEKEISYKNYGVLPEGGAIMDAFNLRKNDEIFTIIRYKDDTRWRYKVCEIDSN